MEFSDENSNILLIPIAFYLTVFALRWIIREVRANRLKKFAQIHDLPYQKEDKDKGFTEIGFETFRVLKRKRRVRNLMTIKGSQTDFILFDFFYTVKNGRNVKCTIAMFEYKELHLPKFILKPAVLRDKVNAVMGFKDINFDDHAVFSRKYTLESNNEMGIRQIFKEEILLFFSDRSGWTIEAYGELI